MNKDAAAIEGMPVRLNAELGEQLANAAIKRADEHSAPTFKDAAIGAIHRVACRQQFFTSDDVWVELDGVTTYEPRALGPRMREAIGLGWIAATDRFVKTSQPRRHRAPVQVWESKCFSKGA
jgi:hypothetical protein